jgi:hypothetical protein
MRQKKSSETDRYQYDYSGRLVRVDMGHLGQRLYEYDEEQVLTRRTIERPGGSALGEAYEFTHDKRGLFTRIDHLHASAMRLDATFF